MTKRFFGTVKLAAATLLVMTSAANAVSVYAAKLDAAGVRVIVGGNNNYYRSTGSKTSAFLEGNSVAVDEAAVVNESVNNDKVVVDAPINVVVKVDNEANDAVATNAETVAAYIEELKAQTGLDYYCPSRSLDEPLVDGMYINLVSKKTEAIDSFEEIVYDTKKIETDKLYKGETKVTQKGVKGSKKITTINTYEGGAVVSTTTNEEIVAQPVTEIIEVGTKEKVVEAAHTHTANEGLKYSKVITLNATAYCPCSKCCGSYANGYTATGMKAGYGVAAVDPKVIPLGTKLYVEGYGYCVAADTGGAIKSNRIDLCYGSHSAALASGFGHKSVKVYVLG